MFSKKTKQQAQIKYGFIMQLEIWYAQYKTNSTQLYLDLGNEQPYMTKSQIKKELDKRQDLPLHRAVLISVTPYIIN